MGITSHLMHSTSAAPPAAWAYEHKRKGAPNSYWTPSVLWWHSEHDALESALAYKRLMEGRGIRLETRIVPITRADWRARIDRLHAQGENVF